MHKVARRLALVSLAVVALGCTSIEPVSTPAGSIEASPSLAPSASEAASPVVETSPTFETATPTEVPAATLTPAPTDYAAATPSPTPPPTEQPTPTASPTAKPAKVKTFEASYSVIDCNVDPEPTQVHLEWSIARATGVELSIDGPGVYDSYPGPDGSADVPFACSQAKHTYTLTTTGGDGAAVSETITVKRAKPKIVNVYADNLNIQGGCGSIYQRRIYWVVENAKGVTVTVGGQTYGPYSGHEGNDVLPYDCRNSATVTYHFETTGYGPAATYDYELGYSSVN